MTIPPHGAVTFLFTDVEGSSTLWEHHPDAMQPAIARHDAILRRAVLDHHGYIVKMRGDGIHAAFASPSDALHAALAAQHALMAEQWPQTGALKVRAALHTANADERDGDYFGPDVNRAARLSAAAHGGQILLSAATQELIRAALPTGVTLRDMGLHRLKDLVRPERIYQVVADSLPSDFPPLVTLSTRPNVLPIQLAPFIGRAKEMADCLTLLRRRDVRLLTLTGPGGSGKTRLGLQIAADLLDTFSHGVFFVDLSVVHDPAAVPLAIARVLQIPDIAGVDPMTALTAFLREKQLLLVLDNCEQVLPAGVAVSQLLTACDGLKVLATSRAPLHLIVEHEYPVPPLAVPDIKTLPPLAALEQVESVQLFVERSTAVRPSFQVTAASAPAVAEICVRLDGLPLAIELAAARSRTLPPHDLLAQLSPSLPTLTGGFYDLPTRHQALRNTIAWSYALLSNDEQRVFRRLGVFAGGWTAQAAAAVCADDSVIARSVLCDEAISPAEQVKGIASSLRNAPRNDEMLSILYSLADQSLIRRYEQPDGSLRFTMLETVREYALERMQESGELADTQERHAQHFAALAEEAYSHFFPSEQIAWIDRTQTDQDNLRAVWQWCVEHDQAETGLRMLGCLQHPAYLRAWSLEWIDWFERLSALPSGQKPALARAFALNRAGMLVLGMEGQIERTLRMYDEAIAIAHALSATAEEAFGLFWQGYARCHGDFDQGRELMRQGKDLARQGSTPELDMWLHCVELDALATFNPEAPELSALAEATLVYCRRVGAHMGEVMALGGLATHARVQLKDFARARQYLLDAAAILRRLGSEFMAATFARYIAPTYLMEGNLDKAEDVALQAYELMRQYGDTFRPAEALSSAAVVAGRRGDFTLARQRFLQSLSLLGDRDCWWVRLAALGGLVWVEKCLDNQADMRRHLRQLLRIRRYHWPQLRGVVYGLCETIDTLGAQDAPWASRLLGAANSLQAASGLPMPEYVERLNRSHCPDLRQRLGDAAFEAAWAHGAALTREQALDYALSALDDA